MIRIYGASDDLVEIEGLGGDEVNCYDRKVVVTIGAGPEGLEVWFRHGDAGWECGIRLHPKADDDNGLIPWPVTIGVAEHGHSPLVSIDCPAGTPIDWRVK